MKTAILNFRWALNYGALLQAYALKKIVASLGNDVFLPGYFPRGGRIPLWRPIALSKGIAFSLKANCQRWKCRHFQNQFLACSKESPDLNQLVSDCNDCDAFITGSDQVWNCNQSFMHGYDPAFFLDFPIKESARRISYAACFGTRIIPSKVKDNAKRVLDRFDSISVRNRMSQELVYELSGRRAEIVLDPTLIYDWSEFYRTPRSAAPYILFYGLGEAYRLTGEKIALFLKKKTGLPIKACYPSTPFDGCDEYVYRIGPTEWLNLIRNAGIVVTNSFHGTAFSVSSSRKVICWEGANPERIADLLEKLDAARFLVKSYDEDLLLDLAAGMLPDKGKLQKYQNGSLNFLKIALS